MSPASPSSSSTDIPFSHCDEMQAGKDLREREEKRWTIDDLGGKMT